MTKEKFNKLLKKLHSGDLSALEPIYYEFYHKMVVAALCILHSERDAEDAASDAMIRLLKYAERKNMDDYIINPGGFMHTVIRTCSLNILKRNKKITCWSDEEVCATEDVSSQVIDKFDLMRAMSGLTQTEKELAIRHFLFGEKIKELNKEYGYHYDSLRRKLREIKLKIDSKL